jgi:circadian clock protein KaiC
MNQAAEQGERSVIYLFEESQQTFMTRSEAIGIPVREMLEHGTLQVNEVEALEQSPQEFAAAVQEAVEDWGAGILMIDGIAGYRLTLSGAEGSVLERLHSLGRYLKNMGVTTIMVDETTGIIGDFKATEENISYLADNIVFLRHLEHQGELRKVIGVLKKRTTDFERTLRQYEITEEGIKVGNPLSAMRGVLHGQPEEIG